MKTKESTIKAILDQGILPLFFYEDKDVSLEVVKILYACGIRVIEYTNRGSQALENFRFLINEVNADMADLHLGIGTIKNTEEVTTFLNDGAHFVVCPVVDVNVGALVHEAGLLWIPGCMTATEINTGYQMQAGIIKIFPANLLGPSYLSAIRDIFPGQLYVPTGGVDLEQDNIDSWFNAGVCAVGMGSKMISKEILANKDYTTLKKLTIQMIEMVKKSRS